MQSAFLPARPPQQRRRTMNSKMITSTITWIAIVALLLSVGRLAAQTADSEAITKLLMQVKVHAAEADNDANTLESYTRGNIHWQTHANQITRIKEHVNDLINDSNEMSSLRSSGSPWQQEAIDHINDLLPQVSARLTAMINHLNDNRSRTKLQAFSDYIRENQRLINKAHEMINDYADYSEAKAKSEALEEELQLTAASETGQ
jgi:wobble nucleotide-excising tRNase